MQTTAVSLTARATNWNTIQQMHWAILPSHSLSACSFLAKDSEVDRNLLKPKVKRIATAAHICLVGFGRMADLVLSWDLKKKYIERFGTLDAFPWNVCQNTQARHNKMAEKA